MTVRFALRAGKMALVVLGILVVVHAFTFAEGEKTRIAVVDFNTDAIHGTWRYSWSWHNLARAASDNLTSELVKTGRFRVIERQQLDKVLSEQNLAESGRIDPTTAARIGKILGVQLIVIGAVTEFEVEEKGAHIPQIGKWKWGSGIGGKLVTGKTALTARLVDTTTAEILGAFDGAGAHSFGKGEFAGASLGTEWNSGMASKILADAVKKLAEDISTKSSNVTPSTSRGGLVGKLAKVDGGTVYVNLGSASGLKVGDRFEIRRVGEKVVDPDSGEALGGEEEAVGVVEITKIVNEKLSIGRTVEGRDFKVGDRAVMK
jgi:curli biogenesis system outer membrane secretion channel CsgG